MVHANVAASAAAATSSSARFPPRPQRLPSSGSFHAGAPFPQLSPYDERARRPYLSSTLRRQSSLRYHTFPTPPPKTPYEQPEPRFPATSERGSQEGSDGGSDASSEGGEDDNDTTPLPWKQLGLLALLSLSEQTALNSIGPYLPTMVASFDEIPEGEEGLYVGLLASSFALAQLATNLFWGYLSDTAGRKPVVLLGTLLLMVCFVFFGFCATYVQLIAVHVAMGLLNGNAAVVPTCLGELTDRTNQSRAFTWLPVMYSLGSITGPALGGLLVGTNETYPFLAPNMVSAALLLVSVVVLAVWFEETLGKADKKSVRAWPDWVTRIFHSRCFGRRKRDRLNSWSSRWPTRDQGGRGTSVGDDEQSDAGEDGVDESRTLLASDGAADESSSHDGGKLTQEQKSAFRQLGNRTTLTILLTYLVFQLANISYNSLYPIFASAPAPTGRNLGPGTIGLSLSFAGLATILFQAFVFQPLKARMGNLGTYRGALLGLAVSMALMPWIGDKSEKPWFGVGSGKAWLYGELGIVLVLKNISAVGGLSSVMLLITNSAPTHETLGTLNGIAQTLSAAGRSIGPFLSGGLFTLSTRVRPKGEALAWGLFAGVALAGWVGTLFVRGHELESADWTGNDEEGESDEEAAETRSS
ncbi:major facilitator superfamily domain-containing protein [Diplogelasinospora grovesii]|uniref:Major facilitator superfamily domain-containing protein n=1 Tax=Diplogelasinospora grovesii TaxID=303347 RepID=A0AAN6N5S7_9PEZI|nr:major facilitator superfamily domain-containing protein [Diplogelasinospora grovesii]